MNEPVVEAPLSMTVEQVREQLTEVREYLKAVEARREALLQLEIGLMMMLQTMDEDSEPVLAT